MIKYTNPFYTINEGLAVLKNLGVNPLSNPFKYDENMIHWPEHVLSVKTTRVYNDKYEYYFETEIHIDLEGFNALVAKTGLNVQRRQHSEFYDELSIHPGSLLKVCTLETKEASK